MQFIIAAISLTAMAPLVAGGAIASAHVCSARNSSTVASTGVMTRPSASATASPIVVSTGAASNNGVSAMGMIVVGGVALFL